MAVTKKSVESVGNRACGVAQRITLRDGSTLTLRPLAPDDRAKILALLKRCSPETLRNRFLQPVKMLPEKLFTRLMNVDGVHHVALVVTRGEGDEEEIVAVGRYHVAPAAAAETAEVSFLVEDAWQRRGIGPALLASLAELARQNGITRFCAETLSDNHAMLSVFLKSGYQVAARTSLGVTHVEFSIA